jgi:UDP-3-O-[3-hydroxymyristoyl] N-acetylglucosamine deacetylase
VKQKTIANSVEIVGIGLHKGVPVKMRLEPLEGNSGIVFYRDDMGESIPLDISSVKDTKLATTIASDTAKISTIEHFMSAVYSYGIDNLRVIIDNDEVPVVDGSAIAFCMLLDEAGIKECDAAKKVMKITKTVEIKDGEKFVKIEPSQNLVFDYSINFDHPVIKEQKYTFEFSKEGFIKDISRARTFGFLNEVQYLRSIGLALGGTLENAIVLDDKKILNPEGLRFSDEFVRHKILDAIGDLSLLNNAILGKYTAHAGSHHLNHLLTVEIIKQKAYELVEVDSYDNSKALSLEEINEKS